MKNYDDGGTPPALPDDSWQDKLQAVLKAMGMGASDAVSSVLPGTQALTNAVAPAAASAASTPGVAPAVNEALGSNLPEPPAPPMPAPDKSANAPTDEGPGPNDSAPKAPSTPPVAPVTPPVAPTAADVMTKLTDGDGPKMQALLGQLKDQDTKSKFANALAIIADTIGNVGNVKAGQAPEGFTSTKLVGALADKQRQHQLDLIGQRLAADPNSQTSQMAQMTLAQSMGIGPNDPRLAKIKAMPALAITQMIPQMTDAVKNNIQKESQQMQAKNMAKENELKGQEIAVSEANAKREQQTANTTAAANVLKDTSPWNPANSRMRGAAQQTLTNTLSGGSSDNSSVPVVHTHADYNALPRGTRYQNANGQMGVKS